MNHNDSLALNKREVSKFMKEHGISRALLEFDGSGDSGQINSIELIGNNDESLLLTEMTGWWTEHKYSEGTWTKNVKEMKAAFADLLEDIAFSHLSSQYGGWEINAGSFGTVVIKDDGSGGIEFNERIEETEYSEFHF